MADKPYTPAQYYPPLFPDDESIWSHPVCAYRQVRNYTCGFASALTVLHTFQRKVDPGELYKKLGTTNQGTGQTAIVEALRYYRVSVNRRYDLSFEDYCLTLKQRKLIIAYNHPREHWIVLYGFGRDPQRILVADPVVGWRSERTWRTYGKKLRGFGMICGRRPRSQATTKAPHDQPTAPDIDL